MLGILSLPICWGSNVFLEAVSCRNVHAHCTHSEYDDDDDDDYERRGVPLSGIISLELCQGSYLFLEATLSRHCPRGRGIQPGIHNLLLYERRLPDTRHHI